MSDTKYSTTGFFDESFYKNSPLFASNAAPQNKDALPENSELNDSVENNVVPQSSFEKSCLSEIGLEENNQKNESPQSIHQANENLSLIEENAAPHNDKNAFDSSLAEEKINESPLVSNKKNRSQKRSAFPKKIYFLPAEEEFLSKEAEAKGLSFSNHVRLLIGLSLNEKGRKKSKILPAFDLDDLCLDE